MHARLFLIGSTLLLPALAQAADPLDSPECRRAMHALQAQEASLPASAPAARAASAPAIPPALQEARREAARACLGTNADTLPAPQRQVERPVSVLPPLPPRLPAPRLPQAAPPAAVVMPTTPQPVTITSCDAGGCWASDGTRLQRSGPTLLGPHGFCTATGPQVSCP
jgi:hypothetical protein